MGGGAAQICTKQRVAMVAGAVVAAVAVAITPWLMAAPLAGAADGVEVSASVVIPETAQVLGPDLSLGEIGEIRGASREAELLRRLPLGPAALPGETRRIDLGFLVARIRQAGIDPRRILLQAPQVVSVTTEGVVLGREEAGRYLAAEIQKLLPYPAGDIAFELTIWPERLKVPRGEIAFRIKASEAQLSRAVSSGSFVALADLVVAGRSFKTFSIRGRLKVLGPVAAARVALPRHRRIEESDLVIEKRLLSSVPASPVTSAEKAVGMRTTRLVKQGQPLTLGLLEKLPEVARGETVTVVATVGAVAVNVLAVALQDGWEGQVIRVQNPDSKKVFTARVMGERLVRVGD
ncbi:MAG: flagellar basal body P-ring formation chaperone FlgA [Firmicutes bacterium]|nr:flagellar basal body P-ring formation chaperone FlgA [Bacillota bacterium]